MEIRKIRENEKREYFDLLWYCHPEPKSWHKAEEILFNPEECFACFQDNHIISGMQLRKYQVNFYGKKVTMAGIGAVATAPENRYQKTTAAFMDFAISWMKDNNIVLSALNPFSYSFYRKYGWEAACERMNYDIEVDAFKSFLTSEYTYKKLDFKKFEENTHVFNRFFKHLNGSVIYKESTYRRIPVLFECMGYTVYVCYNKQKEACGFVTYKIENQTFIIREMGYQDIKAQKALWGFVYRHNSSCKTVNANVPVDDITRKYMTEHRRNIRITSDMMYRIIDVKGLLEQRKGLAIEDVSFTIKIKDSHALWNNGIFEVAVEKGNLTVCETSKKEDVEIEITNLSTLVMGYLTIDELMMLDKITVNHPKAVKTLRELFPRNYPYIQERF